MPRNVRPIRIEGDVAYIPLTKGYEAVIDAVDVPLVVGRNWSVHEAFRLDGTVRSTYAKASSGSRVVWMHRLIAGVCNDLRADHKDNNGLNNRRSNLRPATVTQNAQNQRKYTNNTSGAKGVTRDPRTGRWQARIQAEKQSRSLGNFGCVTAAYLAYVRAAAQLHGEFGRAA
jgi:hypothetical protein